MQGGGEAAQGPGLRAAPLPRVRRVQHRLLEQLTAGDAGWSTRLGTQHAPQPAHGSPVQATDRRGQPAGDALLVHHRGRTGSNRRGHLDPVHRGGTGPGDRVRSGPLPGEPTGAQPREIERGDHQVQQRRDHGLPGDRLPPAGDLHRHPGPLQGTADLLRAPPAARDHRHAPPGHTGQHVLPAQHRRDVRELGVHAGEHQCRGLLRPHGPTCHPRPVTSLRGGHPGASRPLAVRPGPRPPVLHAVRADPLGDAPGDRPQRRTVPVGAGQHLWHAVARPLQEGSGPGTAEALHGGIGIAGQHPPRPGGAPGQCVHQREGARRELLRVVHQHQLQRAGCGLAHLVVHDQQVGRGGHHPRGVDRCLRGQRGHLLVLPHQPAGSPPQPGGPVGPLAVVELRELPGGDTVLHRPHEQVTHLVAEALRAQRRAHRLRPPRRIGRGVVLRDGRQQLGQHRVLVGAREQGGRRRVGEPRVVAQHREPEGLVGVHRHARGRVGPALLEPLAQHRGGQARWGEHQHL